MVDIVGGAVLPQDILNHVARELPSFHDMLRKMAPHEIRRLVNDIDLLIRPYLPMDLDDMDDAELGMCRRLRMKLGCIRGPEDWGDDGPFGGTTIQAEGVGLGFQVDGWLAVKWDDQADPSFVKADTVDFI